MIDFLENYSERYEQRQTEVARIVESATREEILQALAENVHANVQGLSEDDREQLREENITLWSALRETSSDSAKNDRDYNHAVAHFGGQDHAERTPASSYKERVEVIDEPHKPFYSVGQFSMLCVPYDSLSAMSPADHYIDGPHYEKIKYGALTQALNGRVELWMRHTKSMKIGDNRDGVITFRDTPQGLFADVRLPDNFAGNQARSAINFGVTLAASISYTGSLDAHVDKSGEVPVLVISRIERLTEVSLVEDPAYETFIFDFKGAKPSCQCPL